MTKLFSRAFVKLTGMICLLSSGAWAEKIYSNSADLSLKLNRNDGVTVGSNGPGEGANPVGKSGAGAGFDRAAVFVFQLPDLGAVANPFGTATLGLYLFQDTATADVNGDLYGLGRREFPEVLLDDYFGREIGPDLTDATLIQDNYLTAGGSPLNTLTANSPEGSLALTDYLNAQYEGGAGIGQYVFLRVNSDNDTTRRWNFTSVDGANGDLSQTPQITYFVASTSVDTIQVETANDGSGSLVPSQTLTAGETLTSFSIGREAGGAFVENVPTSWSLTNITGGVLPGDLVASADGMSATFHASAPGSAEIVVTGTASNLVGSGTITVVTGPATQVSVETQPNEFGELINDQFLLLGGSLTVFAVSRDAGGNFLANVPATWSLEDLEGGVVPGDLSPSQDGLNATLTGNLIGGARIRATAAGLTSVDSGLISVAEPVSLWDGGGTVANIGNEGNWFFDTAPLFDTETDLVFNADPFARLNPYLGEDRTIRSLSYNANADQNLNLGLTVNGTSGPANLTFDTDSETEPASIMVDADATGNFRLGRVLAPDVNEYGNIILADDLLITHDGTGTLNLDGNIVEGDEPQSVIKAGTGTVLMTGANTYTGDTVVNGGILNINGTSLSDVGRLVIDGGMVEVNGNETVESLSIGGEMKAPGVYGSSLSGAPVDNQDDNSFLGTGTITVAGAPSGDLKILSIAIGETEGILTWNSVPGESFRVVYSFDLETFNLTLNNDVDADEVDSVTRFTFPLTLLESNPGKVFFRVERN